MKKAAALLALALVVAALLWKGAALLDGGDEASIRPGAASRVESPDTESAETLVESAPLETTDASPDRAAAGPTETEPQSSAGAATGTLLLRTVLEDGTPVPGATVLLTPRNAARIGHGTLEHVTDDEGVARTRELSPGTVSLFSPRGPRERAEVIAGQETEVVLEFRGVVDVRGVVRDPRGQPVAGADVWVATWRHDWLGTRHLTRSESDGTFVVRHVSARHSLGATAAGFAPSALVDLELVDTQETPVEVTLVLEAGGGGLRGRVVGPAGLPQVGARVACGAPPDEYSMRNDGTQEETWCARVAVADMSGSFEFTGLAAGTLALHVATAEFPVYTTSVEIVAGTTSEVDVHLETGMTVRGKVTNDAGEPVADALVLALDAFFVDPFPMQGPTDHGYPFHRPATRSDERGSFVLGLLTPGVVHLHASKGTSFWDRGEFLGTTQETLHGETGQTLEWNPVLSLGHSIRGRVIYADGSPLGNVFVNATDGDGGRFSVYAEGEGRFAIPGLENRAYEVSVQLWDSPDDARPLGQEDVWPSESELVLTASYSKVEKEKGTARVRIDDRAERVEGKGAVVYAHERGWTTSDEEDGVFEAELPAGRYQARVMSGDAVVGSGDWFELAPGEVRDLGTVTTRPLGIALVRVVRPAELADTLVRVSVEADDRPRYGGEQLPLGAGVQEVTFDDLLEGSATVRLFGVDVAAETQTVDIRGGEPALVSFELRPAGRVTIQVTGPVADGFGTLELSIRDASGAPYRTQKFHERWGASLPHEVMFFVPPGTFTVEATTSTGLKGNAELTLDSAESETSVTVALE